MVSEAHLRARGVGHRLRRPVARTAFNTPDMFCWSVAEQVPAP